jgi:nucleoside-diphosphate-sugar epimerase
MDLVTGATGFIGSHILYRLLKSGRNVRALYRDSRKKDITKKIFSYYEKDADSILEIAEWVKGDLNDMQSLALSMDGIKNVFHAAGMVSYASGDRRLLNTVNVKGTANIVNTSIDNGVRKLVHISSVATLGVNAGEPADESSMWKHGSFKSDYSVSKYNAELEVWRGINEGLNAVILNPSVVIGPGIWSGAGGALFNRISRGMNFYPAGGAGYVDVRDVADIAVRFSDNDITGERFIINSENITHREVINLIADALGKKRPRFILTPFLGRTACALEAAASLLTGKQPGLNINTLKTADDITTYNNSKIKDALGITFIPVKETVEFSVKKYLEEVRGNVRG